MGDSYFVIRSTEDGVIVNGPMSGPELIQKITPGADGYTWYGELRGFCPSMPHDPRNIPDGYAVIIKGSVVVPRVAEVVKRYEVDW